MAEDLPSSCDVILIGTGLVESIVAAAASRIGKQVIHFDYRDYYGGNWASRTLKEFIQVMENNKSESKQADCEDKLRPSRSFYNFTQSWNIPESDDENASEEKSNLQQSWTRKKLLKTRNIAIDILPKVVYSSGEMVEGLISSGVTEYCQFKLMDSFSFDVSQKHLVKVPCSKADVFKSTELTVFEKRSLMKTLTQLVADAENDEHGGVTLGEFLTKNKVEGKIRNIITENVAFANESDSYVTAKEKAKKFIKSVGRYGDSPFLWILYGIGEFPQYFCRYSAVFGGIYCLSQELPLLNIDDEQKVRGITLQSKTITASNVVVESSLLPCCSVTGQLSRAILITNKSATKNCHVALINTRTLDGRPVRFFELSGSSYACPKDLFVVHAITAKVNSAQEDLEEIVNNYLGAIDQDSPDFSNVLWCSYFNMDLYGGDTDNGLHNLYPCSGPNDDVDVDSSLLEAQTIFKRIFPNEEFLPRTPRSEDRAMTSSLEDNEDTI